MLAKEESVQTHLLDAFITSFTKFIFFGRILVALKRTCIVKVSISHISHVPLVGDVVQEVLHVLLIFNMEFSHL